MIFVSNVFYYWLKIYNAPVLNPWLSVERNTGINCRRLRIVFPLQWHHNGRAGVSNHQPHDCLLNRLFNADQRKHQSSASLAFRWVIHRSQVNSQNKRPVTRQMFPFDDDIMRTYTFIYFSKGLHNKSLSITPLRYVKNRWISWQITIVPWIKKL